MVKIRNLEKELEYKWQNYNNYNNNKSKNNSLINGID